MYGFHLSRLYLNVYRVVPNTDVAGVIKLSSSCLFPPMVVIDPTSVGYFLSSEYRQC